MVCHSVNLTIDGLLRQTNGIAQVRDARSGLYTPLPLLPPQFFVVVCVVVFLSYFSFLFILLVDTLSSLLLFYI